VLGTAEQELVSHALTPIKHEPRSASAALPLIRHADLVIKPRAPGVGLLEFHQLDAAREAGRVAAREALQNAPPALRG